MKSIRSLLLFSVFASGFSAFPGCSDSSSRDNATGGKANPGGKSTGGTMGSGGINSGGIVGSGGVAITGGKIGSLGDASLDSTGAIATTGGQSGGIGGLAGSSQGGSGVGGSPSSGGPVDSGMNTGGATTLGDAGAKGGSTSTGGATASGGSASTGGSSAHGGAHAGGGSINLSHYRIVVSSDFPPIHGAPGADPDDVQSMVRFLLYSNEFDIDGLVASANGGTGKADKKNYLDIIDLYDQVDENLRKHDSKYPTPDSLKAIVHQGRDGTWNKGVDVVIGDGKDSEASNAIIEIVDRPDPRPVWFSVWGGPCEVAQAIWKVKGSRSAAELKTFLGKMRIFAIATQDGSIGWLKNNFPDLFIIHSNTATYWGMTCSGGDKSLCDVGWLDKNIRQGHGPLGAIYPDHGCCVKGMQEGDTPSFLHLISGYRKINDPEKPDQNGWGGAYKRDGSTNHWVDGPGGASIEKFRSAFQKEFADRADWMVQ